MNNDLLYNFISPITGRILCDKDYVLVGNRQNIATPSPALIDIKLDIINIRENLNQIKGVDFVIGHPSTFLPKAQVLSKLDVGYMYNSPAGTVTIKSGIDPVDLKLSWGHIFTGNLLGKAADTSVLPKTVLIGSDNPLFYGQAEFRIALHLENMAPLKTGYIWKGDATGRPEEVPFPTSGAPTDATYVLIKADDALPNATSLREVGGLLGGILWTTGITGSLRIARGGLVPFVDDYVDPFSFDIYAGEVEAQLLLIEAAIAALETAVEGLTAAILTIQGQILTIQGQIVALFALTARPLNKIADVNLTSGHINFNQWKGYNVADPTDGQDIVNLRTLVANIPTDIAAQTNTWYVDSINGDDTYSGHVFSPFKTIQKAIDATPASNSTAYTIYISNGTYIEDLAMSNKRFVFKAAGNQNMIFGVFLQGKVDIFFSTSSIFGNTVTFQGFLFYSESLSAVELITLTGAGASSVIFDQCKFNNLNTSTDITFIWQSPSNTTNLYLSECKFISGGVTNVPMVVKRDGILDISNCLFESSGRPAMVELSGTARLVANDSTFNSFYNDTSFPSLMPAMVTLLSTSLNNSINNCYFTGAIASADNKIAITIGDLAQTVITFCYFRVRVEGANCILYNSNNHNLQISSCYALEDTAAGVRNLGTNRLKLGRAVGNCGDLELSGDVTGFGSVPGIINTTMDLSLGEIGLQNPTLIDVDLNLKKAVRMADPLNPLDGVNLQTAIRLIGAINTPYASATFLNGSVPPQVLTSIFSPIDFNFISVSGNPHDRFYLSGPSTIEYRGTYPIDVYMNLTTFLEISQSATISLGLYLNGNIVFGAENSLWISAASEFFTTNLQWGLTLNPGDELQIYGKNNAGSPPLTWEISTTTWYLTSTNVYS